MVWYAHSSLADTAYREAESIVIQSGRGQARIVAILCVRGSGWMHMAAQTRGRRHRLLTVALVNIAVASAFCTYSDGTGTLCRIQSSCTLALGLLLGCPS